MTLRLGILDFGGRRGLRPSWTAIGETVRAAKLAERLGYHRYWLAEHQALGDAWGAAAIAVGHLAALTQRIRIGTAGVLVGLHDAFDVASDYRLLSMLYPDRIDLGLAGGGPSMRALTERHAPLDYVARVAEIVRLLRLRPEALAPGDPLLVPVPSDVTIDMPWVLGSSARSRDLALSQRTAFCYSLFHAPRVDPSVVTDYLDRFEGEPKAAICASVICAETDREAEAIRERQAAELAVRGAALTVCGPPHRCAEQLHELAATYRVHDVIVHDVARTVPERRRCYELLAGALLVGVQAPEPLAVASR